MREDRLALVARAITYGEKIEHSGPVFESVKFEGGRAVVSFTHVGGGLVATGGHLTCFLLCGSDKKFVWVEARIEGTGSSCFSEQVPKPVAVCYGWERNPDCNLCNKEGKPSSPFRRHDFVNYFTRDGTN